jgi:hypothetical protein
MKPLIKTLFLAGIILFSACSRKPNTEELLQDDTTRHNIMQAISNDHNMAVEMVHYLTTTDASRDLMQGSCTFMESALASDIMKKDTGMQNLFISNMVHMMNRDSVMCDKTCTQISQSPQLQRILERKTKSGGK